LEKNPAQVHELPSELVERCEAAVRQHAAADAWEAARAYVEGRMHDWEHAWGGHSSEAYVAKNVTDKLARELKRHEPSVEAGAEVHLAGEEVLGAIEPEARQKVIEWVCDLARQVEHKVWAEIVRFTKKEGGKLARAHEVSDDVQWDATGDYSEKVKHIARLVLRDYDAQSGGGTGQ
jgi:hypothetical protein